MHVMVSAPVRPCGAGHLAAVRHDVSPSGTMGQDYDEPLRCRRRPSGKMCYLCATVERATGLDRGCYQAIMEFIRVCRCPSAVFSPGSFVRVGTHGMSRVLVAATRCNPQARVAAREQSQAFAWPLIAQMTLEAYGAAALKNSH